MGDTHILAAIFEGIHISLVICVRGYTYYRDTHITVTPEQAHSGYLVLGWPGTGLGYCGNVSRDIYYTFKIAAANSTTALKCKVCTANSE